MTYQLQSKELNAILALTPEKRLKHFIKRIADWEEVWGLKNDADWVLCATKEGNEAAPFWPHSAYAQACAIEQWNECQPALIKLEDFIKNWLPGLQKEAKEVAVFPTPDSAGFFISPDALRQEIIRECQESYGDDD